MDKIYAPEFQGQKADLLYNILYLEQDKVLLYEPESGFFPNPTYFKFNRDKLHVFSPKKMEFYFYTPQFNFNSYVINKNWATLLGRDRFIREKFKLNITFPGLEKEIDTFFKLEEEKK